MSNTCANGHPVDAGYAYCPHCGAPVHSIDEGPVYQAAPPPPYGQMPAPPPYGQPAPCPQYGPQYGLPYPPPRGTNGLAVTSLILGILWIYWVGSILALIFGYVARNQIRRSGQEGNGLAIAGIVLGWIGVAALIIFIIVLIAVSNSNTSTFG
jgi:hypothetical protein